MRPGLGTRALDTLARADTVLGLQMDEYVCSRQAISDLLLHLVGRAVGVLERRSGLELKMKVDVAAVSRPAEFETTERAAARSLPPSAFTARGLSRGTEATPRAPGRRGRGG